MLHNPLNYEPGQGMMILAVILIKLYYIQLFRHVCLHNRHLPKLDLDGLSDWIGGLVRSKRGPVFLLVNTASGFASGLDSSFTS